MQSTTAFVPDQQAQLESNKESLQRFLLQLFEEYNRKKMDSLAAGPDYEKWLENSLAMGVEKREHVKPCLFNAISCPKYPFKSRAYK